MTLKGLNQQILEFYGHPAASRAIGICLASILIAAVCCIIGTTTLRAALARWRPGSTNL